MSKDTGGHSFPNITPEMNIQGGPGMTLRDYFAAQAMIIKFGPRGTCMPLTEVAAKCFEMADAMLAERAKGGEA